MDKRGKKGAQHFFARFAACVLIVVSPHFKFLATRLPTLISNSFTNRILKTSCQWKDMAKTT